MPRMVGSLICPSSIDWQRGENFAPDGARVVLEVATFPVGGKVTTKPAIDRFFSRLNGLEPDAPRASDFGKAHRRWLKWSWQPLGFNPTKPPPNGVHGSIGGVGSKHGHGSNRSSPHQ